MQLRSSYQPLSRRLLSHYLMFGLVSIITLSLAWFWLGHSVLGGHPERDLIHRIHEVRSLIVADLADNRGVGTQALVGLLGSEVWVAYAGVIDTDGTYVAHSKPTRVGKISETRFDLDAQHTVIERHVVWQNGSSRREYWVPLASGSTSHGCLQVGVVDDLHATHWHRMADWLPYAILAPILTLGIGGLVLQSTARTNAAIEGQLCAVSAGDSPNDFQLQPLTEPSPAAQGWNRLVERALGQKSTSTLDAKLSQSLGSLLDKRFERILSSLPDGVAMTDKEGHITYANRALGVLLQQSPDTSHFRGRPIQELFSPGADLHRGGGQETRPIVFEVPLGATLADGVLRVSRSPVMGDEHSSAMQHVWTVRDITQQKLADEMRTQFVYSATHELRTPLANIKAYAETLAINELTDPEQQKSFLNTINAEATRLARFVEELLNVSQMEAGSLSLNRTEVDLERLLTEIGDKVRPQMVLKQITFDVLLPPKLPKIQVDKDKFVAALVNLLGNAAKYTPDNGCVTFKVTLAPKELQISVEDTGIGISSDEVPKLCTKFFRSADDRVRDLPGSGLGLAFTQEVARLHGGKLAVHSELNKGSQFTITMPIA